MSLSVGRCLWDGVGQAQRPDCRANDQRAPAANLLRCPQFADTGVSFAGRDRWRWDKYGGVYSMVSTALSGQEAAHALDGASYHRGGEFQVFLEQENAGLPEADWKVTCMLFAPNAPEQNPTEDVWLKGKTHLRKQFAVNKTFAQVKRCFSTFLNALSFTSAKLSWYWPTEQMI